MTPVLELRERTQLRNYGTVQISIFALVLVVVVKGKKGKGTV